VKVLKGRQALEPSQAEVGKSGQEKSSARNHSALHQNRDDRHASTPS
jgi:hypothetical protein